MPSEQPAAPCVVCETVADRFRPPGGVVYRDARFVAYGIPSPVLGYVIVASRRHVRGLYDLDDAEAAAFGPLLIRIQRAQMAALGADHAYAFVLGDKVPHFHAHVVPRYADPPAHLRGGRLFHATDADARPRPRPVDKIEAATLALSRALCGAVR